VKPQLAALVKKAPDGPDWLHEIKLDGYRMHARLDAGQVKIITRRGNDWTAKYPSITKALASLPADTAYLDGELCGVLQDGRTAFNMIQNAMEHDRTAAAIAVAPYLHPKLSIHRITGDPEQLTDEQLVARVAHLEAIAAAMPEHERVAQLENQLDRTFDEVQQLPPPRRETFFRKMAEASEAGLRRLNEPPPGAVLRRPSDRYQPSAEPPADQRYDPRTRKLLPAA
jgi:ATP-dependent DNA ligase